MRGSTQTKGGIYLSRKKVKDEVVLAALITQPSIREASKACGLSQTQIYSRLKEPEFSKLYKDARRDLLAGCMVGLQAQLGDAVNVMSEIMKDSDTSAQTRLNAAEAIVRNSLKITEQVDILGKLDELERMMEVK